MWDPPPAKEAIGLRGLPSWEPWESIGQRLGLPRVDASLIEADFCSSQAASCPK